MRRRVAAVLLAAATLAPGLLWLSPALTSSQAPVFRDQADFFYPLKLWTADRLKAGEIPLWNPFSGGGEPWLANGQSGPFYPPTWLFLLPSPALAAALFLLLHFAIGAAGTWRFVADEGGSETAAAFAATAFAGGGYAASLSAFWNHFGAWCWLPWIAAIARSGLRRRRDVASLALAIGLQAMAGSPEMSLVTLALAAAMAAFPRAGEPPADGWRQEPEGRPAIRFLGGTVLGLAFAAWALLPMAELSWNSSRRAPLPAGDRELGALSADAWASGVGLPASAPASNWVHSIFLGSAVLFAVVVSTAERERRRIVFLLLIAAAIGLLLSFAGPPGSWLRSLPPLDRFRYPSKYAGLSVFALAALAGFGADALRFRRVPAIGIAAGGIASVAIAALSGDTVTRAAGTVAAAALVLSALVGASFRGILQGLAVVALAATLWQSSRSLFAFAPEAEIRRVATSTPFLRRVGGRILTPPMGELARWALREDRYDSATLARQREALLGYTNLLAGVGTLRTSAPLPTTLADDVARAVDAVEVPRAPAGAAGARALWTPFPPPQMGSAKKGDFFLAPIEPWRARVSFYARAIVDPDAAGTRARSLSATSDDRGQLRIDRPGPPAPKGDRRGLFVASLVEDAPARVSVTVENGTPGYLVLADAWYPGWRAEADGRALDIYRADGMFRAVFLEAGSHRVVFTYRPLSALLGGAVSLAALASIGLLAFPRRARVGRPA